MRKRYIARLPDQVGAFMKASEIVSNIGGNIIRCSYNKAVDVNTLFLDVTGSPSQIEDITTALKNSGYIAKEDISAKVLLLELKLEDKPGSVYPILELINNYNFNISYISSAQNGTNFQNFKLGIYIEKTSSIQEFLSKASEICEVKIVDYDMSEKYLDNTVFYMAFAGTVAEKLNLDSDGRHKLLLYSNVIMQALDELDKPSHKTFEFIGNFADCIAKYKGNAFNCKLYNISLAEGVFMYVIEPPVGACTYIIQKENELLFIDCGFACYREEMINILDIMISGYKDMKKEIIITHSDIDHCGLLDMFDKVYVTQSSYNNFLAENSHEPNIRESKVEHLPYCKISKVMSGYKPPKMETLKIIGERDHRTPDALEYLRDIQLLGETFEIYQGNGGHVAGEIVIKCERLKVIFTGDVMVNVKGFSKEQHEFNLIAPYLMTSVNTDSKKALQERKALSKIFDLSKYNVCCGHGSVINIGKAK